VELPPRRGQEWGMDGVDGVGELRWWKIYAIMLPMMLISIFRFCWNIVLCMWTLWCYVTSDVN
jgi:hypothetical protein